MVRRTKYPDTGIPCFFIHTYVFTDNFKYTYVFTDNFKYTYVFTDNFSYQWLILRNIAKANSFQQEKLQTRKNQKTLLLLHDHR